ncbi:MAG: PD-(D/E)XK nuclease family protein [Brachymonas sp.]|nr:PD-(D/E)XK nuclease family protein [Brachymonas sp.]
MAQQQDYRIRASSFGELFDCALRWEAKYLRHRSLPNSPRALIGTGVHAGTAVFDLARAAGGSPISADDAAGVALDAITERIKAEGVRWVQSEPDQKLVETTALRVTTVYCQSVSPLYEWEAVELETKPLAIDCGGGMTITLTGTLDRARIRAGSHGITDLKTGRAAVAAGRAVTKKHRPQLGTYELLYEHSTGNAIAAPGEILGINTSGSFAHGTADVHGAKALLTGTEEHPGLIELAAATFRTGLFHPNPQSTLCDARYCPNYLRCPYSEK